MLRCWENPSKTNFYVTASYLADKTKPQSTTTQWTTNNLAT